MHVLTFDVIYSNYGTHSVKGQLEKGEDYCRPIAKIMWNIHELSLHSFCYAILGHPKQMKKALFKLLEL